MTAIHATFEPLEWENQFFQVNSSLLRFDDSAPVVSESRLTAWSRVQAKIPAERSDLLDSLQKLGFHVVEGDVDLSLAVSQTPVDIMPDVAGPESIATLRERAARVFKQSRFRAPWYRPDDSGRFYAQWVENAVLGRFDDQCLVIRDGGDIRGFVTLRQLNAHEARIGLLAGPGLGNVLMSLAETWCRQRGLSILRVATQVSNTAALRLYLQCGATINSTAFWLYR